MKNSKKKLNKILNDDQLKIYLKKKIEESEFKIFEDRNISFSSWVGWYVIARAIKPKLIMETGAGIGILFPNKK